MNESIVCEVTGRDRSTLISRVNKLRRTYALKGFKLAPEEAPQPCAKGFKTTIRAHPPGCDCKKGRG